MSLPEYMKPYLSAQNYDKYTPTDHAAWRFIMRCLVHTLKDRAVPIYIEGLKRTGIPLDRIPRIEEMNEKLARFGWQAVGVSGFIPPSFFIELMAHKTLPIATDMRTIEHIGYTPAPDIVHEAAGHAPILADADYREFLTSYAEVAHKAIITSQDIEVYEAVRYLSDIKENPDTTSEVLSHAEVSLEKAYKNQNILSEATRTARYAWWTTEYGLVGSPPRIYGAGLLSSVSESENCLSDKVKKLPLSITCTEVAYDITRQQPQLFVASDMLAPRQVLDELQSQFAFRRGGVYGLERALEAKTINTVELDSGLSISGLLSAFETCPSPGQSTQDVVFIKTSSPTQLCYGNKQLKGHDKGYHVHGYSTPLGRLEGASHKKVYELSEGERKSLGLVVGSKIRLKFLSAFELTGFCEDLVFQDQKLLLARFRDCTVKRGENIYFEASWGMFDLAFGERVVSVYAGPSDRAAYGDYFVGNASTTPGRQSAYSEREKKSFLFFQSLYELNAQQQSQQAWQTLADSYLSHEQDYPWLCGIELLIAAKNLGLVDSRYGLVKESLAQRRLNEAAKVLVQKSFQAFL
jgi:phenylalanine-4-hydroxylase